MGISLLGGVLIMSGLKDILTPVLLTFLCWSAEWEERREKESL